MVMMVVMMRMAMVLTVAGIRITGRWQRSMHVRASDGRCQRRRFSHAIRVRQDRGPRDAHVRGGRRQIVASGIVLLLLAGIDGARSVAFAAPAPVLVLVVRLCALGLLGLFALLLFCGLRPFHSPRLDPRELFPLALLLRPVPLVPLGAPLGGAALDRLGGKQA